MKTQTTAQRLKQIMNEQKIKQIDILNMSLPYQKELGIKMSKSHLSQYINGKSNPDKNKLYLLSKTLNVSEAWLMGFEVSEKSTSSIDAIYNKLNKKNKQEILHLAINKLHEQTIETRSNITSINKKKYATLAAHAADPNHTFSEEEILHINKILDKIETEHQATIDRIKKEKKD